MSDEFKFICWTFKVKKIWKLCIVKTVVAFWETSVIFKTKFTFFCSSCSYWNFYIPREMFEFLHFYFRYIMKNVNTKLPIQTFLLHSDTDETLQYCKLKLRIHPAAPLVQQDSLTIKFGKRSGGLILFCWV